MGTEWLTLVQTGESRIKFIMPWMLRCVGDVQGLKILDLDCGEGGYARRMAMAGARVVAVDCSEEASSSVPLAFLHRIPLFLYWQMRKN